MPIVYQSKYAVTRFGCAFTLLKRSFGKFDPRWPFLQKIFLTMFALAKTIQCVVIRRTFAEIHIRRRLGLKKPILVTKRDGRSIDPPLWMPCWWNPKKYILRPGWFTTSIGSSHHTHQCKGKFLTILLFYIYANCQLRKPAVELKQSALSKLNSAKYITSPTSTNLLSLINFWRIDVVPLSPHTVNVQLPWFFLTLSARS
jgi:hypothetical protein